MEPRIKYPRTFHLPWSLGRSDDDKILQSVDHFSGKRVIVTEKMDGENTTMLNDYVHARSLDSANHYTRNWVKQFHANYIAGNIPGMRLCGENLYAVHSVQYENLKSYFYGFSMWDNINNVCLSWEQTLEWFSLLGVESVPVLYDGIFDEQIIRSLWNESMKQQVEGYVVRSVESFHYNDFKNNVAKFVRRDHVQTDQHWMTRTDIGTNRLIDS